MADFTTEELSSAPPTISQGDIFSAGDNQIAGHETLRKRDEASTEQFIDSFYDQALKSNSLSKLFDWGSEKLLGFEPDEDYQIDDDTALGILQANELPMKYFGVVRGSGSLAEQNFKLARARREVRVDELINNTLSDSARTTASVTGAIADIDMVVGLGVGTLYSKSASLAKVFAYEGVAEGGLAATHFFVDDAYTVEDGLMDATIGLLVVGGATQLARSFDNSSTALKPLDADAQVWKWSTVDPAAPVDVQMRRSTLDIIQEGKRKQAEVRKGVPGTVEYEIEQTRLASVRRKIRVQSGFSEEKITRLEAEDLAFDRDIELAKQREGVRFENYNRNRAEFFKTQERIGGVVLDRKLKIIDTKIDSARADVKKLNDQLAAATDPKWRTRYKNQLKTAEAKLADARASKQVDLSKKPMSESDLAFMRGIDEMSGDIITVRNELYDIIKGGSKADVGELTSTVAALSKANPKEMEAVKRLFNSKMNNKTFNSNVVSLEKASGKRLSSKQKKLLAGATLVLGTGAIAGEGEENIAGELTATFIALVALAIGGPKLLASIKNANMREAVKSVRGKLDNALHSAELRVSPQAGTIKRMGAVLLKSAHTRATSTIAPYIKAGGSAKKIMQDLLYSAESGGGAEIDKAMWAHSTMFKYSVAENQAYKAWKLEEGVTVTDNVFNDMNAIHRFRQMVSDNMELRDTTSDAIKQLTTENDELMKDIWGRAKEYEVFGFEKINYKEGMIPRLWKSANLNTIISKISDKDVLVIRDAVANAIFKTNGEMDVALKQADRYVASWKKGFDTDMSVDRADDVFGSIGNLLKDDVEFTDFADALNISSDKNARAKYRIDFNIHDLEPTTVNIDGVDVQLTKSDFVERDFKSILDRQANSMYGSAALAKQGYKSVAQLNKAIDTIDDPLMRHEMKLARDLVLGIPIPSNNKFMHEMSMIAKDLTMVAKLPFVVFSMPPELISTLSAGGFVKGVKAVSDAFMTTFGKNSEMISGLMDISGLGTGTRRIDTSGYRGLTDNVTDLDDAGVVSAIREQTMKMRDFSMLANGLSYFSDVLQRAGLQLHAEKFANFVVHGDDGAKGINQSRLQSFGIDDKTIAMFKDTFEFNDKGFLKPINYDSWSLRKRDKFGEVLRNMNQATSPEVTIGETGLYTKTTDLGRSLSALITYPMQQFNIHGLEDLQHMDRMAFMHSVGGFAGAYLGLHARYSVQDKEMDDEKVALYALMNVPQFGGFSAISSMMSPATLDTIQGAANVAGMDAR